MLDQPDNPHLELGDPSIHDDEPYCSVNAEEHLYGPDPFDEDNTNPDNYWYISSDDEGTPEPHQPPPAPTSHPVEEGNPPTITPSPTECDQTPPPHQSSHQNDSPQIHGRRDISPPGQAHKSDGSQPPPPFLTRIKTTARKSTIRYMSSHTLAWKRPAE